LDCQIPVGQITVALATGIERIKVPPEFVNQLTVLAKINGLQSVTMAEFSKHYREISPSNPEKIVVKDNQSQWVLTPKKRENLFLGEKILYRDGLAFKDFFTADKARFLDRKLPISQTKEIFLSPYLILFAFLMGLISYSRNKLAWYYWPVSFYILASFLTTFLTYTRFGRTVYFGPVLKNTLLVQFLATVISFGFFFFVLINFSKRIKDLKLLMVCLPFSYGCDFVLSVLRYTNLHSQHYFGFAWDPLRFVGFRVFPKSISLVNQDFPSIIAGSLLKFDFNLIWENNVISLIAYPLAHFVLGILVYFVLVKLHKTCRRIILVIMLVGFCFYLYQTITLDPRIAL